MPDEATTWKPDAGPALLGLPDAGAITPNSALTNPRPLSAALPPFDPGDRIVWALQQALREAGGTDAADNVVANVTSHPVTFAGGVIAGVARGIEDEVSAQINGILSCLVNLLRFYAFIYDSRIDGGVNVWVAMLQTWAQAPGSGIGPFEDYLKSNYPELWTALKDYGALARALDKIVASLKDDTPADPNPWTKRDVTIADWAVKLTPVLAALLRPTLSSISQASASEQGAMIGETLGKVIVIVILIVIGLVALVRAAAAALEATLEMIAETQEILQSARLLSSVETLAATTVPEITNAASSVAKAETVAEELYQAVSWRLGPHGRNLKPMYAFNQNVADVYGYAKYDIDYIKLRLNSHHVVEQNWFEQFSSELKAKFGWNSTDDMDAVVIHEEWHIRSGKEMARLDPPLVGADKEPSLTNALKGHLKAWQDKNGNITTLKALFEAHEDFYKTGGPNGVPYSGRLWSGKLHTPSPTEGAWWPKNPGQITNLETWFAAAKAVVEGP